MVNIPSLKLTWLLKIDGWKMFFLLGMPIFRGYVSFRECNRYDHSPIAPQEPLIHSAFMAWTFGGPSTWRITGRSVIGNMPGRSNEKDGSNQGVVFF